MKDREERLKIRVERVVFPEPEERGWDMFIIPPAQLVIEVDQRSIRGVDFQDLYLVRGSADNEQ